MVKVKVDEFTPRERTVLSHLCAVPFQPYAEIAERMGIEPATLRTHIAHMLAKCGAHDARDMVIAEMARRMETQTVTILSQAGSKRLAVITVAPVLPLDVDEAIIALNLSGENVSVLSINVQEILEAWEGGAGL